MELLWSDLSNNPIRTRLHSNHSTLLPRPESLTPGPGEERMGGRGVREGGWRHTFEDRAP